MLWNKRIVIVSIIVIASAIGVAVAMLTESLFRSEALIAPKESQRGGFSSSLLSNVGGLGSLVSTQLGLSNTNIDRIAVAAKGWEVAESTIVRLDLMQYLFRNDWDSHNKRWKVNDSTKIPSHFMGRDIFRKKVLRVTTDRKTGFLIISVDANSPYMAEKILSNFLNVLNRKLKDEIVNDASTNIAFLEDKIKSTTDPLVQGKIRQLIAMELERMMLISSSSFDVLDKPYIPEKRISPKRKLIVVAFFSIGCIMSIIISVVILPIYGKIMADIYPKINKT